MVKETSKDTRKISSKNYIIFAIMCILTIVLVIYLSMWYETRREYYMSNSVMSGFLASITKQELVTYTTENPNSIIYLASSNDNLIKDMEKKLKRIIVKNDLNNQFVYLDSSQPYNNNLQEELKNMTESGININSYNFNEGISIIIFENGKIKSIFHKSSNSVNVDQIEQLLKSYGAIE